MTGKKKHDQEKSRTVRVAEPPALPYLVPSQVSNKHPLKDTADRSMWSPKLRVLIEKLFPEETKQERIRLAKEKPLTTLDFDVPIQVVKYYAEDVDFECDR
ncbi:MAG: hypothetical protein N3D11_18050 [Candidatus Sumerlaeia bacterium]|nr:hypothetical protein [Candidatus Sumerlaeia bacterium]